MAGTEKWDGLPETIYLVIKEANEKEKERYWSTKLNRVYKDRRGVASFLSAHPDDNFRVYCGKVVWILESSDSTEDH